MTRWRRRAPPDGLSAFDAICSSNMWLFWSDPQPTIRALSRPGRRTRTTPREAVPGSADPQVATDLVEAQIPLRGS